MLIQSLDQRMVEGAGTSFSLRFQLFLMLSLGVALPTAIFVAMVPWASWNTDSVINTGIASVSATIVSLLLLRRISAYPGVRHFAYVAPAIVLGYGAAAVFFTITRLPHSNYVLVLCFIATLGVRFWIASLNIRSRGYFFCLVPGGRVEQLHDVQNLETTYLLSPELPKHANLVVVADLHYDHDPDWERVLARAVLDGVPVYHYKQIREAITGRVQIEHLSENSFGALLPSSSYRKIKRLGDIVATLVILPFALPAMAAVAIAIRFENSGPILFRQKRIGYRGELFQVVKFRTMAVETGTDGSDREAAMTKNDDDRITPLGGFLRRTRLDELPQIFNIIRGEMSWIGPRPEAVSLAEWYEAEIPFYSYRHIVRPGISGWAQVNQGHVTDIDEIHAKLQFDFFYVRNFSYWLDLLIALRTVIVMLNGTGAR